MKTNGLLSALLVVFCFFLNNCSPICCSNCSSVHVKGNGNVESQEREVKDFHGVILDGVGSVNIYYADNYKVIVTTDSNIQEFVTTKTIGNNLLIGQEKIDGNFRVTTLKIDVYLPELNYISLTGGGKMKIINGKTSDLKINQSGVGDIEIQNYEAESLFVTFSGGGNINIDNSGKFYYLEIEHSGVGNINAEKAEAENVTINFTGGGAIKTWVTNNLTGTFSGVGSIFYKGNPSTINVNRVGIGVNIIRL